MKKSVQMSNKKSQFVIVLIINCVLCIVHSPSSYGQADMQNGITESAKPSSPDPADGAMEMLSLKELLNVKVTTASKTSIELEKAPATIVVVTQEQIRMRGYQSLLDVLYDLPDMKVDDKVYSENRNNFTVRGTQGQEKFVILLDGVRISSPTNEVMPIMENYPVNVAEQIEIVFGPASALYGADALSGVINIITKKAPSKKGFSVDASSVAGMYGYTNNSLFIAKKLSDHANLVLSGQYSYDQGADYTKLYKNDTLFDLSPYKTGAFNSIYGPMTPQTPVSSKIETPSSAYNMMAALHVDDFTFTLFRNYSQTPSTYENNPNNTVYNKNVFMGKYIDMANASYKKTYGKITSTTTLTGSEYHLNSNSNYRNLYTGMEPAYKFNVGSMLKVEQQVEWKACNKLNVTGGGTYESYYSMPESADLDAPVNPNDFIHGSYLGTKSYYLPQGLPAFFYSLHYHNTGSYVQAQYSPLNKISFTIGARYDDNSRYGSSFNPRAGVVYKPFNRTTVKALYGTAFLAPYPNETFGYWGTFVTADSGKTYHSYFMHLPNPGLKPVLSRNMEVSIQQYLSDNFSITADGYCTQLRDMHGFADDNSSTQLYHNSFNGIPVDYIEVFINHGEQETYGGSLQLNWKQNIGRIHLNSYASVSYVTGRGEDPTNAETEKRTATQLDLIAPLIIHAGTDIKVSKLTFSPRLIWMNRQNITGIADTTSSIIRRQTIAGYTLLNLSVRYNATKHFSVFCNVTNALNQQYRSVSYNMDLIKQPTELFYGQHEDPIRIMGGINLTF